MEPGAREPVATPVFDALADALRSRRVVALATAVEGRNTGAHLLVHPGDPPETVGSLGDAELDRVVARDALGELAAGVTGTRHYGPHGEARGTDTTVFIETFGRRPRLLIFGAVDFTAALASLGRLLGYHVTVCDARSAFATERRFPMADVVVNDWPDRHLHRVGGELGPRDAVCVLTHDHKFDIPALVAACRTEVGYIGAMGSRRTHSGRIELLRSAGLTEDEIARIMAPIGLDLGARTPQETAVAIFAEVISRRSGRRPDSLRDTSGPIH